MGADLPVGDQDVQGLTNIRVNITNVQPDSPADFAGLRTGDLIKSVNFGEESAQIDTIKSFQDFTKAHAGQQIVVVVQRDGQIINLDLSPRVNPPEGQGAVGVGLERMATLVKKYSWYQAPLQGVIFTWQTTYNTLKALYHFFADLIAGKGTPEGAAFAGPLGITIFLANAASYGTGFFLYFIGVISVLVAVFNLFPIPALDGGKLIFLIIEKIKGKPVSVKVEQNITLIFFIILICLSLFITVRFDIPRVVDYFNFAIFKK
jgi:regulator of sigma E protease